MSLLVRDPRAGGMRLGPGQCFGWKVPVCLGGEPNSANVEPTDLVTHVSQRGPLDRQIRSMPAGTNIDPMRIVAPGRPDE